MTTPPKILIVDDKPQNLYALELLLKPLDVELMQTTSGIEALRMALEHGFCMAIVDVQMPEMDGYELVELLRGNESTANLPVIFVSAIYSDEYHHRKGYEAGAVDFLTKPFVPEILLSKVKIFLDLYHQRRTLEELVWQLNDANEILSKRSVQLETGSKVGKQATSILDPEILLQEVTNLIVDKFDYYAINVWLWGDDKNSFILKSSTCRDGRELKPGFILPVSSAKLVAAACNQYQAYLANNVEADPNYTVLGDLPETQAELILPLQISTHKIGALDIHSDQVDHFSPDDVIILQMMADQIAIAVRNAQLYTAVTRFNEELEIKVQERTAEVERAYQQLQRLDQSKSSFIGVISHELRTPLSLIKGYSQMLVDEPAIQEDPILRQQLTGIVRGALRMHELINSMLDMLKIDNHTWQLRIQPVSLTSVLIGQKMGLDEALIDRKQTLTLDKSVYDLPEMEGDPDALDKLFNHLMVNAIKFTPDGGQIFVTGRVFTVPQDNGQEEEFIEIIVTDTGIGIDAQFLELIFNKFYQTGDVSLHSSGKTKFKGGGPGLGLAICRGIVEAHNGRIWAESPGHDEEKLPGAQFHVLLPVLATRDFEIPAGEELADE